MSHNSKYYVKKLTKRDGSKSMRLEQFGFKKKFLMKNDSNCNESSESERARLLRMQTYRPVTNPSHQCWNPKISLLSLQMKI